MRSVQRDMVTLRNAEFGSPAKGWFGAVAICPSCGERRNITVPISELGKEWRSQANCNKGHRWEAQAKVVK